MLRHQAGQLGTVGGILLGGQVLTVEVEQPGLPQPLADFPLHVAPGMVGRAVSGVADYLFDELDLARVVTKYSVQNPCTS